MSSRRDRAINAVPWRECEDDVLMDMIAEGQTFREVGVALCRTRNAAIGRFHRLATRMGPQAR